MEDLKLLLFSLVLACVSDSFLPSEVVGGGVI